MTEVRVKTIVQSWSENGPNPMRVWGKLGMTCPNKAAGGREEVASARVVLATERLGGLLATGHADSNGWSLGVIAGAWGVERKVVTIGAGIGNACVMSW